ncbi:hypothetical protein KY328_02165 [Candidatus Woesearchaeota archaeon]|nr:hypothetical protein [Candidatus Woesearchaeota archaeon]
MKNQTNIKHQLLVEYEDLILEYSRKMLWLVKTDHGKRYRIAVATDIHNRTIARLEFIHQKLLSLPIET